MLSSLCAPATKLTALSLGTLWLPSEARGTLDGRSRSLSAGGASRTVADGRASATLALAFSARTELSAAAGWAAGTNAWSKVSSGSRGHVQGY